MVMSITGGATEAGARACESGLLQLKRPFACEGRIRYSPQGMSQVLHPTKVGTLPLSQSPHHPHHHAQTTNNTVNNTFVSRWNDRHGAMLLGDEARATKMSDKAWSGTTGRCTCWGGQGVRQQGEACMRA